MKQLRFQCLPWGMAVLLGYFLGLEQGEGQSPGSDSTKNAWNSLGMKFVRVPRGTFWMGERNEQRQVAVHDDYFIGVFEVTQGEWKEVMGTNPSNYSRTGGHQNQVEKISTSDLRRFPVEGVSWDDVQRFIANLNAKDKGSGWVYRLPTEAEWEYACRGAVTSREDCSFLFYFDKPTNDLSSTGANCHGDYPAGAAAKGVHLDRPTKVGSYPPNRLGIHDMHGNVWEWCQDSYEGNKPGKMWMNPHFAGGQGRAIRGGSWYCRAEYSAAGVRNGFAPSNRDRALGFRLAAQLLPAK